MKWDAAADAKLLTCILKYAKLGKDGYEEIAKNMGNDCTATAIKRRLEKIRDRGKGANFDASPPTTPAKSANGTPQTPKARTPGSAKTGGSRTGANKRKELASVGDDNGDYNDGSPVKRVRAKKGEVIKSEDVGAEEDQFF
ncbi:hypothetical protein FQN55_001064 [Onygenales sp. PD_40]|nr:hypothetical protein FQN55_001064 [Onygenales sp. PD_40]KAK2780907.1 hypothetical protein FQN52_002004 [Onygenales sp. PD_12]